MSDNNYEIFKYLKPNDNDKLSLLGKHDREELIYYLDKYYLEYRNFLGLSKDVTFGLEIESENLIYSVTGLNVIFKDKLLHDWYVGFDPSLNKGCEVNSPILTDNIVNWANLSNVCFILSEYTKIDRNCSAHVHIGSQILGEDNENWLNFIRLWAAYEKIIYRFSYGEYLTQRPGILAFADMLSYLFLVDYSRIKNCKYTYREIAKTISHNRKNQAVNFKNVGNEDKNTIEFRCPNGTLNPIIWQNNVNFFVHLLEYSKSSNFNQDIVSKRCVEVSESSMKLSLYKTVYFDIAIELSDLVFNNNLDKIYFLRQYLKSFEIGSCALEEARPFTRNLGIKK